MSFKRISLNLIHYFQDYRQLSRICIKDDIQTIGDVEKYVVKIFNIENNFYLMCNNYFLPSPESIHLLDDNDLIYVIPNFQTIEESELKKTKKSKNKQRSTANIEETEPVEPSKAKKKKVAKNQNNNENVKKPKTNADVTSEVADNITDNSYRNEAESKTVTGMEVNETVLMKEVCDNDEEKTRKRRRCISPVQQNGYASAAEVFPTENYFRISEHPKIINNNSEKDITVNIVQSIEVVNKEKQWQYNKEINKNPTNRKSFALDEVLDFAHDKNPAKSFNGSRISYYKQHSGIGNTLKLLSGENSINDDSDEVQSENNFITKRKRIRNRRRKPKTDSQDETLSESPVFKPPNTIAAPKSHIKFTNDENVNYGLSLLHSTPKLVNNNEIMNSSINNETNLSLINIDPTKVIELTDVPSVSNIIMFKKLKMGENYMPVISNYILGKVTSINENGETIGVHILDGHDELKEPTGRFSCILEDDENVLQSGDSLGSIILQRSTLIEPKLLPEMKV